MSNGIENKPLEEVPYVHTYSRREAIEDGVLMDASEMAKEAGFRYPVALTKAVWERYVCVPDGVLCQDEAGRLWDILWMMRCSITETTTERQDFCVHVRNDNQSPKLFTLKAVCGPGDNGEPVITVMLPDED